MTDFTDIIDVGKVVEHLCVNVGKKKKKDFTSLSFGDFWDLAAIEPEKVFRNIFQLFCDGVNHFVEEEDDEYPNDPESIGFVSINCDKLLIEGMKQPFFPGRLFANSFLKYVNSLRSGAQQNKIIFLYGPHGCGKSTFLNNLLKSFKDYTNSDEGRCYEISWKIDKKIVDKKKSGFIKVSCPSHCHPITVIPKEERRNFLDGILKNNELKRKIFVEKEYEWIFEDDPCTICQSLFDALFEKLKDIILVFDALRFKPYKFDRRLGQGVSVFNPGDKPPKNDVLTNPKLQKEIDKLFGDSQLIRYMFSRLARTNNGIYVLADVKSRNVDRLVELHNVITEGVHRVEGEIEERVNSLLFALANPGDKESVKKKVPNFDSFKDRIFDIEMAYPLDVKTEVQMHESIFGDQIKFRFLPRILDSFARIIISTRMKKKSPALDDWVTDLLAYSDYCDIAGRILRMEIAGGNIPDWLTKEDKKKFKREKRKALVDELKKEGRCGFSGRESIQLLDEMLAYFKPEKIINMNDLLEFIEKKIGDRKKKIPEEFTEDLLLCYDVSIIEEMEEALYDYNEERIDRDIKQYMYAVNCNLDTKHDCPYTNEEIKVTESFLKHIESMFFSKKEVGQKERSEFRQWAMTTYGANTFTQEIQVQGKNIAETELYGLLHDLYVHNLKDNILTPLSENDNFRRAILDFGDEEKFKTYDKRIRQDIIRMFKKLSDKFGYTEQCAKEICIYAIDNIF